MRENMIEKGIEWLRWAIDEGYTYIKWDGSEQANECPICCNHSKDGGFYGGNCVWLASAYLYHGMGMTDVKCAGNGLLGGNANNTLLLYMPRAVAQAYIDSKLGAGRFKVVRKATRGKLTTADLKRGDIINYYRFGMFQHVAIYIGDGKIIDSAEGGIAERSLDSSYTCRMALRMVYGSLYNKTIIYH